jgi:predicted kinase
MNHRNILYLVRGLPGSGKSTFATMLLECMTDVHYETDMFFTDPDTGEYKFDATELKRAHQWCYDRVEHAMSVWDDARKIVVSNTFTQEWEMQPYIDLAKKYGYTVFTIIVENRHGGTNTHNVPEETLTRMRDRFEVKL